MALLAKAEEVKEAVREEMRTEHTSKVDVDVGLVVGDDVDVGVNVDVGVEVDVDLCDPAREGPCAESARAVTGRRCPHSWKGEDFLTGQPDFFLRKLLLLRNRK